MVCICGLLWRNFDLLSLQFNYDSGRDDYQDER